MNQIVKQIFATLGANNVSVNVQHNTLVPVAGATGINPSFLPFPVTGVIFINNDALEQLRFNDKELIFILAHECAHIYQNHIISKIGWSFLESILKGPENKYYVVVELIKGILALLSRDGLPPNAESLRDNEYEADEIAVRFVTNDIASAVSCLRRLSGGNDESPSHNWEFWNTPLPAMSVRERISELHKRIYRTFPSFS